MKVFCDQLLWRPAPEPGSGYHPKPHPKLTPAYKNVTILEISDYYIENTLSCNMNMIFMLESTCTYYNTLYLRTYISQFDF